VYGLDEADAEERYGPNNGPKLHANPNANRLRRHEEPAHLLSHRNNDGAAFRIDDTMLQSPLLRASPNVLHIPDVNGGEGLKISLRRTASGTEKQQLSNLHYLTKPRDTPAAHAATPPQQRAVLPLYDSDTKSRYEESGRRLRSLRQMLTGETRDPHEPLLTKPQFMAIMKRWIDSDEDLKKFDHKVGRAVMLGGPGGKTNERWHDIGQEQEVKTEVGAATNAFVKVLLQAMSAENQK